MASSAEEYALGGFGARGGERSCDAGVADAERLSRGIDVMEVESCRRARVAAEDAGAAGFGHQDALHLAPTTIDRFRPAARAAEGAGTAAHERHAPVLRAEALASLRAGRSRPRSFGEPAGARRRELVALEPVADRRVAHAELLGDRADRHSGRDEWFERLAGDAAAGGVSGRVG